ncbi:MAG: ACP S-malonyltransferase [Clostridiales bacterium]|nr:ACP S-malonyltransferase [Clostridiales bacterium]
MNKTAILFSGQGAQTVGMGKDLYEVSPIARRLFDGAEAHYKGITDICFNGDPEMIKSTEYAQPCLFLTGLAFALELKSRGITADCVAGFSLGEIPALAYSGVLSEEDAFSFVLKRAGKMAELSRLHSGAMIAALKLDAPTVEGLCAEFTEVWPVNYNCPGQISCSGRPDQIDSLAAKIQAAGGRAIKLAVSGAFHTPYMAPAEETLRAALANVNINAPTIPLYADLTGEKYSSKRAEIIDTVSRQVCSPVRFETILSNMAADGVDTFIEVGAGSTLTGFVKRALPDAVRYTVTDVPSLDEATRIILGGEAA